MAETDLFFPYMKPGFREKLPKDLFHFAMCPFLIFIFYNTLLLLARKLILPYPYGRVWSLPVYSVPVPAFSLWQHSLLPSSFGYPSGKHSMSLLSEELSLPARTNGIHRVSDIHHLLPAIPADTRSWDGTQYPGSPAHNIPSAFLPYCPDRYFFPFHGTVDLR